MSQNDDILSPEELTKSPPSSAPIKENGLKKDHNNGTAQPSLRQSVRIAIIGAGIAGLKAADDLLNKHNFQKLVLFEATNQIGGRISAKIYPAFFNVFLNFGADSFKFEKGPLALLARDTGCVETGEKLLNIQREKKDHFVTEHGALLTAPLAHCLDKTFELARSKLQRNAASETPMAESLADVYIPVFWEQVNTYGKFTAKEKSLLDDLLLFIKKTVEAEYGAFDWTKISVRTTRELENLESEEEVLLGAKGFEPMLMYFRERLGSRIRLSTEVKKVVWQRPFAIDTKGKQRHLSSKVQLELANGKTKFYDHVIVTCPIGFLINSKDFFSPPLPDRKMAAINAMGVGILDKIILFFDKPFWNQNLASVSLISDDKMDERFGMLHVFQTHPHIPNALITWASGANAEFLAKLSDDEVSKLLTKVLRQFLQKKDIPKPSNIFRSSWGREEFFRGSLTYYSCSGDLQQNSYSVSDITEPLMDNMRSVSVPVVLFAGEATHSSRFQSVDGAFESGEREAQRLAEFYDSPTLAVVFQKWINQMPPMQNGAELQNFSSNQTRVDESLDKLGTTVEENVSVDKPKKPGITRSRTCCIS